MTGPYWHLRLVLNQLGSIRSITLSVYIELSDAEAWNLAQCIKRVGFSEYRSNAQDGDEAYAMRDAIEHVRSALAAVAYLPR